MSRISEQAPEIRVCTQAVELRERDGKEVMGVVTTFGDKVDVGPFIETMNPSVFDASLKRSGKHISLLDQHDAARPVASNVDWIKTETELRGVWMFGSTEQAKRKYDEVNEGLVSGFSVGFAPAKREGASVWSEDGKSVTRNEARLLEVSLVAIPANPGAVVEQVRTMGIPPGVVTPRMDEWRTILENLRRPTA